jgi:hypothetical protein
MIETSIASILPGYIQSLALVVGAGWAYWKFVHQRANEPATDIDIDLHFIGMQDGKRVIEIVSTLTNQSLVRVNYKRFRVSVRYLLPTDDIEDGEQPIHYQLKCPRTIDDRIDHKERYFANVEYINPKQEFKHRYVTFVPAEATFVWIQCEFFLCTRREVKVNSQRIFGVPGQQTTPCPEASPATSSTSPTRGRSTASS